MKSVLYILSMSVNRFCPSVEGLEQKLQPSPIIFMGPNANVPALVGHGTRSAVDATFMQRENGDLAHRHLFGAGSHNIDLAFAAMAEEGDRNAELMPMPPAAPPMTPTPKAPAMPAREIPMIKPPNPDIGPPSKQPSMYREIIIPKPAAPAIPMRTVTPKETVIHDQEHRASISPPSAAERDETSAAGFLGVMPAFGIVRTSKERRLQPSAEKKSPPSPKKGGWKKRLHKAWRWLTRR